MTLHDPEELTAHALGLLDGPSAHVIQAHLGTCADCRREWGLVRETAAMIGSVPAETLVDGPPMGDLALRRALRQIRAETTGEIPAVRQNVAHPAFRRGLAAAAAGLILLGGGTALGRITAPGTTTVASAEGRTFEGTQGSVHMTTTITPANGWVRLAASVQGLAPNQKCTLFVISKDGTAAVAGSWLTGMPVPGRLPGSVNGSTIVDPSQVRAVAVRNDSGETLISVPVPAGV